MVSPSSKLFSDRALPMGAVRGDSDSDAQQNRTRGRSDCVVRAAGTRAESCAVDGRSLGAESRNAALRQTTQVTTVGAPGNWKAASCSSGASAGVDDCSRPLTD